MCGIAGIVGDAEGDGLQHRVERIVARQAHRGPDARGLWAGGGVALGHNRLSIIDLEGGRQPMQDPDGRFTLVYNGEIYNFLELRRELEHAGERFVTRSDTEVLLKLYQRHGEACVQHLNGMFAFAIWDDQQRTLFLARDRLGVKPLYYWSQGRELRFASELDALRDGDASLGIDPEALLDYLNVLYVPDQRTIFSGIAKLRPAHWALWRDGELKVQRYWDPWRRVPDETLSEERWREQLEELFLDAVKCRLISDVPLGAFLSGGVDSSAVVAAMASVTQTPVKTFSIGFEGDDNSELPYARMVAERYHTEHHERIVRPPQLPTLLELIARHFGEPFADSSAVPTLLVSEAARERVTVALSGDGGDELFAGYDSYGYYERLSAIQARLGPLAPGLRAAALRLPPGLSLRAPWLRRARTLLVKLGLPLDRQWAMSRGVLSRGSAARVLAGDLQRRFLERAWTSHLTPHFRALDGLGMLDQLTRVDMRSYLPDDLLVKVDRMSMAKSLEVRSPFLDYRLVELALAIPMQFKRQQGEGKALLKRMLLKYLPAELLYRRKQGFTMPLHKWFQDELYPLARDTLLGAGRRCEFLDRQGIEQVLDEHRLGRMDHGSLIWALLVLETWLSQVSAARAQ